MTVRTAAFDLGFGFVMAKDVGNVPRKLFVFPLFLPDFGVFRPAVQPGQVAVFGFLLSAVFLKQLRIVVGLRISCAVVTVVPSITRGFVFAFHSDKGYDALVGIAVLGPFVHPTQYLPADSHCRFLAADFSAFAFFNFALEGFGIFAELRLIGQFQFIR